MTEDRGKFRISNADRDDAIAQLNQALQDGRLELPEFDSRSQAVYAAKTNAELDLIFEDLPGGRSDGQALAPTARPTAAPAREPSSKRRELPGTFQALIWVGLITTTIWLISSISSGEVQNFWPVWPIGVLTAVAIAEWITGGGDDDDDDDDDDGKKQRDDKRDDYY